MQGAWYLPRPLFALCLFALAFSLRVVFAVQWQSMPYGGAPLLDAQVYDQWAWVLANGKSEGAHAFYQSPLYPYLLSVIYLIVGHSYFAASVLGDILDSATVVLLGLMSYSLAGRSAAILSGVLGAFYAPMIFYTAPPMKEPLVLFLLALFCYLALRSLNRNRIIDYLLCGLAFGGAVLARGNVLLLAPVLPIFTYLKYKRKGLLDAALFLLAFILVIAPAAWHNFDAAHDFVPISYADGFNLYIGHSPYANGTNAYPPEVSTGPEQERLDTTWIAENAAGKKLTPSEVSAYWRSKAVDFALHNPLAEFELLARKFFAFWNGSDSFDNYDASFIRQNFPSLINAPLVGFWLITPLAAFAIFAGIWRLQRKRVQDFKFLLVCAFLYMGSVLIFYVTDRYRLPVVVFLIPLAGAALPYARKLVVERRKRELLTASLGALLFLALALSAPLDKVDLSAFDWGTLVAVYADKGDDDKTLDAFQKGTAISMTLVGSQAYIRAAGIYEKLGQAGEAETLTARAVQLFPQDGVALYNLGRMQALRGAIGEALLTMQKAQQINPTYVLTYYAIAELFLKKGEKALAQDAVQKGLTINPEDTRLLSLLEKMGANSGLDRQ